MRKELDLLQCTLAQLAVVQSGWFDKPVRLQVNWPGAQERDDMPGCYQLTGQQVGVLPIFVLQGEMRIE